MQGGREKAGEALGKGLHVGGKDDPTIAQLLQRERYSPSSKNETVGSAIGCGSARMAPSADQRAGPSATSAQFTSLRHLKGFYGSTLQTSNYGLATMCAVTGVWRNCMTVGAAPALLCVRRRV